MTDKKTKELEKKDSLKSFKLYAEKDTYPKRYMTRTAGKRKPWRVRTLKAVRNAVVGFVLDIIAAVKAIIKEVM